MYIRINDHRNQQYVEPCYNKMIFAYSSDSFISHIHNIDIWPYNGQVIAHHRYMSIIKAALTGFDRIISYPLCVDITRQKY